MSIIIPKCADAEDYLNYSSSANPTTQAQFQSYIRNQNTIMAALADSIWQPLTEMAVNKTITSPNIPAGMIAECTVAGTTGAAEPSWDGVEVGDTVNDGDVTWKIKQAGGSEQYVDQQIALHDASSNAHSEQFEGKANIEDFEAVVDQVDTLKEIMRKHFPIIEDGIIYGFHINGNESDPTAAVTYIADAAGMTPAHMNYDNNVFEWGSWEGAFFMPKPCMLKYDGTVDYYLNPNDYTLKEDGTASDIANSSYAGNAMMEWGQHGYKIWYKIVPDESRTNSATVYIANFQADTDYVCYSFVRQDNTIADHFYTAIYNGSNVSSRLRSISGVRHMVSQAASTEITYAQANGVGWNIETFADRTLINLLIILMGKSLDTQKTFGNGHYTGGSAEGSNNPTGLLNSRGMFWGSNGNEGVKVFGMENWWAEVWRRQVGLMNVGMRYKIKFTEGTYDGTETSSYNTSGVGYLDGGACPSASNSNISTMRYSQNCMLPSVVSGSNTQYFSDSLWSANGTMMAICGGYSSNGSACGAFALNVDNAPSYAHWNIGACLSYR